MPRVTIAALAAAAALAVGGCGGDDSDDRKAVETAVHSYFRAFAAGDAAHACDLLSTSARNGFLEAAGARDCPSALGDAMSDPAISRYSDRLEHARVIDVKIDGERAVAEVSALSVMSEVPLRKEGDDWKIEATPGEQVPDE